MLHHLNVLSAYIKKSRTHSIRFANAKLASGWLYTPPADNLDAAVPNSHVEPYDNRLNVQEVVSYWAVGPEWAWGVKAMTGILGRMDLMAYKEDTEGGEKKVAEMWGDRNGDRCVQQLNSVDDK